MLAAFHLHQTYTTCLWNSLLKRFAFALKVKKVSRVAMHAALHLLGLVLPLSARYSQAVVYVRKYKAQDGPSRSMSGSAPL